MNNNTVVEKIVDYIETHINEDLPLDKIAKELNYSKFYIARTFKSHTGVTIYKYIQGRCLDEAARKLVETDQPIVEIAFEAGYSSQQAFTQAFRHTYTCTPQQYRRVGIFMPKQDRIGRSGKEILHAAFIFEMTGGRTAS